MGYCVFNNIAIAAKHALENRGLRRVAIVDYDVHHGNGTQKAFYEDDRVLFISLHQDSNYPIGSGRWLGAWGEAWGALGGRGVGGEAALAAWGGGAWGPWGAFAGGGWGGGGAGGAPWWRYCRGAVYVQPVSLQGEGSEGGSSLSGESSRWLAQYFQPQVEGREARAGLGMQCSSWCVWHTPAPGRGALSTHKQQRGRLTRQLLLVCLLLLRA